MHRFNLFGRKRVGVVRDGGRWRVFYLGVDGKKRSAPDIIIPADIRAEDLRNYLGDLFHEYASLRHPMVERIEPND
jgi:hypothetical protein